MRKWMNALLIAVLAIAAGIVWAAPAQASDVSLNWCPSATALNVPAIGSPSPAGSRNWDGWTFSDGFRSCSWQHRLHVRITCIGIHGSAHPEFNLIQDNGLGAGDRKIYNIYDGVELDLWNANYPNPAADSNIQYHGHMHQPSGVTFDNCNERVGG